MRDGGFDLPTKHAVTDHDEASGRDATVNLGGDGDELFRRLLRLEAGDHPGQRRFRSDTEFFSNLLRTGRGVSELGDRDPASNDTHAPFVEDIFFDPDPAVGV